MVTLLGLRQIASAQFTKLLDFDGTTNGSRPWGSLISDGIFLYGMTIGGGTNDKGTIFKLMLNGGGYVKLLDFAGATNGSNPFGSLISDGIFLYGMTAYGGTNDMGTLFKVKLDGSDFVKLLDFAGATNGSNPQGSLISDGTFLYGMTAYGGTNDKGTIFRLMPDGSGFVKLLDFAGATNGSNPQGSLISNGTFLYGMAAYGGVNSNGTLFKLMPDGSGFVKLWDFAGATNGRTPNGALIYDATFLYGMTFSGGASDRGTIFKLMPDGSEYLKMFAFAGYANGTYPYGALILEGTFLYGMPQHGGTNGMGTIFKINPDGSSYVKLLDFDGATKGSDPVGPLISDGSFLYGMTTYGGTYNKGVVFKYGIATAVEGKAEPRSDIVYPNPTSGVFTIQFPAPQGDGAQVDIFTILGDKIYSSHIRPDGSNPNITEIDLSKQAKGIYFYQLTGGKKLLKKGKIIVE